MSLRQNSTTRWSPLKRRWKEVLLRYFLTANSFEQDRRWKNLKDLWWSWKPCWMGDYISIYYFAKWGKYLKMFPPKYAQGERRCAGRLLSFPIRYDRPIHRGNNKAINYLYLHWTGSNHEINGEIKLLASDSTSSCLPSSGWRPPPRRSITPHIISCFDWNPQEDRRKIPEGASLGLYREDGKEHRKPVYKQVEEWFCVQQLSTQFVDLIGLIKVDGNYRLHFNSDGQWVVSRLGSPIPG